MGKTNLHTRDSKQARVTTKQTARRNNPACRLSGLEPLYEYEYYKDGDVILAGLISAHYHVNRCHKFDRLEFLYMFCRRVDIGKYRSILSFIFAVDEINKDPDLLPNITLGYHIVDTFGDPLKTSHAVFNILSGRYKKVPNYHNVNHGEVAAFVVDSYTHTMLPVLDLYMYTQLKCGVGDFISNDKDLYPTSYKLSPDDRTRFMAVVKFLQYVGCNWVGLITTSEENNEMEARELSKLMAEHEICTEYIINVGQEEKAMKQMSEIHKSTARVLVICGPYSAKYNLFIRKCKEFIENVTLIFHETWVNIIGESFLRATNCSLVFKVKKRTIAKVTEALHLVNPSTRPNDPLLEEIWFHLFHCLTKEQGRNIFYQWYYGYPGVNCTETYYISPTQYENKDTNLYYAYISVYILAQALHMMKVTGNKPNPCHVQHKLHKYVKYVHYTDPDGRHIYFDDKDSKSCHKCPEEEWPDAKKVRCVPKTYEFLSYEKDIMVHIFLALTLVFSAITLFTLRSFIYYRDTPIVRANNRTVSFILLVSILLSFLCVFFFLGRPVDITCMMRQVSFGIFFSVGVSSVLAKTITVCIAFKATKPGSVWLKWVSFKVSNAVVWICSSVQVLICVIWLLVSPPYVEFDHHTYPGKIIIQCNEGSDIWFYSMLGYLGFLAAVSFVLAFMVRTLPDTFNEAKYITFSMLVFCSVWIAMIPAYLSTTGKYMVAVEVFAILTSCAGILGCIFFPKVYILHLKPNLNSRKIIMEKHKL
ncbi:vomeronasal type-2 receptor 26-like [Dendropsophus ebraccatus]|uniref:vomeronasal type-2 receptor 26-like n=1 Tax=Dendropsophus ebraccatus TaxID=150705 RepID=UPI003831FA37